MGDEARLEQVFHNLIGNAVKYSPSGGHITVRIECVDAWVHVVVSDQGIGIPEAAQQQGRKAGPSRRLQRGNGHPADCRIDPPERVPEFGSHRSR